MKQHKIIVVGGGTAGIMAATYIKTYWGDLVEVVLVYDHSKPGIGVGESLTPVFNIYLDYVGISREELIKHCNCTVKLGLKFKNWLNDGKSYYHNFDMTTQSDPRNMGALWDIATNNYDGGYGHSAAMLDNNLIPYGDNLNINDTLHIDATLFSKYVENKFKDKLTIIDDEVIEVRLKPGEKMIDTLVLKTRGDLSGDFYIDATGFSNVLFKPLGSKWNDMTDWLPIDSCIPNPVEFEFIEQPPYTTSEATEDGWILQVPLSNRWGSGYLFNSSFTDEEKAFDKFEKFVKERYNTPLKNTSKVLKFKSGYWDEQWIGNCIVVGLSSGFAEPLEATNIHHTVFQLITFIDFYNFKINQYDIKVYNQLMKEFYYNIYLYLRFCYTTNRTDSEFWKYITYNTPDDVINVLEKIKRDPIISPLLIPGPTFISKNFTTVAYGLGHIDSRSYADILTNRALNNISMQQSKVTFARKKELLDRHTVNHRSYIAHILKS